MSDYRYGIILASMFSLIPGVIGMFCLLGAIYQWRAALLIPSTVLLSVAVFIYKSIANVAEERRQKGMK